MLTPKNHSQNGRIIESCHIHKNCKVVINQIELFPNLNKYIESMRTMRSFKNNVIYHSDTSGSYQIFLSFILHDKIIINKEFNNNQMFEGDRPPLNEEQINNWMRLALEEGYNAVALDEIPVGCVFIRWTGDKYQKIASSHNLTNLHNNASRHCQINCIYEMESHMTMQEISKCVLIVTVEPCIMCTFALNLMGITEVYFGQFNDKFGGCGSLRKDNKFQIRGGVMEQQSFELIKSFYERGNQRLPEEQRNRSRKKVKREQ